MNKDHEEAVRAVRFVGESLVKNAESIVGNEELFQGPKIHVTIDPYHEPPCIIVVLRFEYLERSLRDEIPLEDDHVHLRQACMQATERREAALR